MLYKQKHIIPSGEYLVSSDDSFILEAFLGSCVGVTLWDPETRVGGLHHLLLPEPLPPASAWQPEKYARTGLPLFIEQVCDKGADKGRLQAVVGGGALIGPISDLDLNLDIGGRTADIACAVLEQEKIVVIKRETGGYSGCRMCIDLGSGETRIMPLWHDFQLKQATALSEPTPAQILQAIQDVKPIPQIAIKVLRMLQDETSCFDDLATEIRQDQIISAKVIQFCNSPVFGLKMGMDSIDRALILMGQKHFLQLVVSSAMADMFHDECRGYSLCKGGLYSHSLSTAVACERMARSLSCRVSPDVAYTAGLLHDIGKVVLDQYVANAAPLFYRRILNEGQDLIAVEKQHFNITHPQIGMHLAGLWSLPEVLLDPIAHHHEPELARKQPELTCLVYLADLIQSRFATWQDLERMNTQRLAEVLSVLKVKPDRFSDLIDKVSDPFQKRFFKQTME
jgi:putative nucleotidyltransferase with HDIG domain